MCYCTYTVLNKFIRLPVMKTRKRKYFRNLSKRVQNEKFILVFFIYYTIFCSIDNTNNEVVELKCKF